MSTLLGIRIQQFPLPLEREVPARVHKRRRSQSASYHARVQKKWLKRWGTRVERYALIMNPNAAGLIGAPTVALDPRHMVTLRNFIA